jgi:uncharacterized protein (TIGR02271 family)
VTAQGIKQEGDSAVTKTIVGTFDTIEDADRVAVALEGNGIARNQIQVIDNATVRDYEGRWSSEQRGSGGFWSWLFGGDEIETERGRGFPEQDTAYYAEGLARGDALVLVTTRDEYGDRARQIMERYGAQDVEARAASEQPGQTRTASQPRGRTGEEEVLPVVEEQVKVGKRTVGRGGVRVYSYVSERPIEEHIRLRDERIKVERRRVDRPLTGTPGPIFEEQTFELTESSEEPVVEKQARVVEEVTVGKEVHERDETIRDKARRTEVEVERTGGTARSGFATLESEFRQHCTRAFSGKGLTYEQCSPAYQYGYELAGDKRYGGEWTAFEANARREWEERHPGTWERFKDAIRYAWDRARGKARAA